MINFKNTNTGNKILIICPSRGGVNNIEKFYKSFKENSLMSDIVFSLDHDDYHNYPIFQEENVFYEVGYNNNIVQAMNSVAYKYAQNKQYEFIGMLNDDHFIETYGWDKIIYEKIKDVNFSIAVPNDLHEDFFDHITKKVTSARNIFASCVIMDCNIVRILGYFANPMLDHAFPDRIWIDMGKKMNTLIYCDDAIVRHERDNVLRKERFANNYKNVEKDEKVYKLYLKNFLSSDIAKLFEYRQKVGLNAK